jgi:uncharacterized protein
LKISTIQFKLKKQLAKLIQSNSSGETIAFGFALGTFIAILPTPGFGIFIGLFLAYLFKKLDKLSIILPFAIWNPFLLSPIYYLSLKLGEILFNSSQFNAPIEELSFWNQALLIFQNYLAGNLILALTIAFISYITMLAVTKKLKSIRKERKLVNMTMYPETLREVVNRQAS